MTLAAADAQYGAEAVSIATRHAYWRAGDLRYHLSGVQLEARSLVYGHRGRRVLWETNRRFGKSRSAVTIANEKSLAYPGLRIPYAAPTGVQVEDFVEPHLLELSTHAPPDIAPERKDGDWVFPPIAWYDAAGRQCRTRDVALASTPGRRVECARFKGKGDVMLCSSIVPRGCDDKVKADRLRGPGTIFVVLDEAGFIRVLRYVVKSIVGPMFWEARSVWGEHTRPMMLVCSTPPEELDHPFVALAEEAEAKGAYFHADVYDCDHLNEQDIAEAVEEAGGEDTEQWQREGLGKRVVNPEHMILPEFSTYESLIVREVERPSHFLPHLIGDTGFTDLDCIAAGYYDFKNDLDVIEDEIVEHHATSELVDERCKETEKRLWPDLSVHRRRVDAAPKVRADMSREDFQAIDEDDSVRRWASVSRDGSTTLGGRLRSLSNAARVRLKRGRVVVHPRCKTIIAHAKNARWNPGRTNMKRVVDENGDPVHHYDGCAALLYFVRDLDRHTNPYPEHAPGVHPSTHHIRKVERKRDRDIGTIFGRGRR